MKLIDQLHRLKLWRDTHGQDMVEYALLSGFIAVAAGASIPPIAEDVSIIFSKVTSLTTQASLK